MPVDIAKIEATILDQHQQLSFSGVILLEENKKIVLAKEFGMANKAEAIPNKIDTKFGIASGAKIFTAVAICQLIEKGLLHFDTRLKDCLPIDFPQFDPAVTVGQLLSHTSGIPDYFDEEVMSDFAALWKERPMYEIRSPRDFLPMFQNQPMKFAPGTSWAYNNAGFIVLGLIIEQLSGRAFPEYIQTNIFDVCGMGDSGYYALDMLPGNTAYGYIQTNSGDWKTNFYSIPVVGGPDGGVFVSAPDILKFWENLFSYKLLSPTITETLLGKQAETGIEGAEGISFTYGYGIWRREKAGELLSYYIEGEDPGVRFIATVYPGTQIRLVVVGNTVEATSLMQRCIRIALS